MNKELKLRAMLTQTKADECVNEWCRRFQEVSQATHDHQAEVKKEMEVTEKNCRVADKIIEVLIEEKCTVKEAQDIMDEVTRQVRRTSTVQMGEKFSKRYCEQEKKRADECVNEWCRRFQEISQASHDNHEESQ